MPGYERVGMLAYDAGLARAPVVYRCSECSALVETMAQQAHADWHELLSDALADEPDDI